MKPVIVLLRIGLTALAVIGIFSFTENSGHTESPGHIESSGRTERSSHTERSSRTESADLTGKKQLPPAIAASLQAKYANARIKKWEMQGDEYVVNFIDNKKKCTAYYSSGGRWIKTEITLPWTRDLPQSVKTGLQLNGYEAYHVDGIKEVLSKGQPEYVLHVDDGDLLDADHYDAFRRDYRLSFSQNGILKEKMKYQN